MKVERLTDTETFHLEIPADENNLGEVRDFISDVCARAGFSNRETSNTKLAVDEACTNIIKHAYGGASDRTITITVSDNPEKFTVRLRDFGVKADSATFLPRDLADIQPGRLGMHFIRQVFDAVTYDTSHRQGTELILEKRKQQVPV